MNTAMEHLATLTVADVMTDQVFSVARTDSMEHAAEMMLFHEVHGLAVVDEQQRCIGILSSSDFVHRCKRRNASYDHTMPPAQEYAVQRESEAYRIVAEMVDAVGTYMTDSLQTVTPRTPLTEAIKIFHDHKIHRIPVVAEDQRPVGMVTVTDIVDVLAASL